MEGSSGGSGESRVSDGVALLWERFRDTAMERLETLESMGIALLEGRHDSDLAERALHAAHKLHGSLGTFGRARGSVLAAELESLLEAPDLDATGVRRFSELVVDLRTEMETAAEPARSTHPHSAGGPVAATAGPSEAAARDPETGLPSRASGQERLTALLGLAERFRVPVTVALLHARHQAGGPGTDAVATAATTLASRTRPGDVVARWSDMGILVALYGLTRPDAADRLRDSLDAGEGDEAEWSAGLAEYPADGSTAGALLEHARLAADASNSEATLFPASPAGEGPMVSDVVIVEDDEALGHLLVRSLEDRGHTTHWVQDGMEALRLLTGEPPALRGRVLLLDVGLPGLDGLSLLRQLVENGVARRTRVVMLTARSAESEVVRSLELGAFDHVAKPFSVSELTQRVRRALEGRRFE